MFQREKTLQDYCNNSYKKVKTMHCKIMYTVLGPCLLKGSVSSILLKNSNSCKFIIKCAIYPSKCNPFSALCIICLNWSIAFCEALSHAQDNWKKLDSPLDKQWLNSPMQTGVTWGYSLKAGQRTKPGQWRTILQIFPEPSWNAI